MENAVEYYVKAEDEWYEAVYSIADYEYEEGKSVEIYYNPDNPSENMFPQLRIDSYEYLEKVFYILGGIVGGLFLAVGLLVMILGIHLQKKAVKQEC